MTVPDRPDCRNYMRFSDNIVFSTTAIRVSPVRTGLMLLAMGVGVAAVITLAGLGEASRSYVLGKFSSLGTNLLIVMPGRNETVGGAPPILGTTPRDITIGDADALRRSPAIRRVAPIALGIADASVGARSRQVTILGSNADLRQVRNIQVGQGSFLPEYGGQELSRVCVIGMETKRELFGSRRALGKWLRIADTRYRVIGVLNDKGESIGIDFKNVVIIPTKSAQTLLNSPSLFRIFVEAKSRSSVPSAMRDILEIIRERHNNEDDITVVTQDALLHSFDDILQALNLGVIGIAGISLVVAGILIMNVMLISVAQRTGEIGVLNAVGATRGQITGIFLVEAVILSLAGALLGSMISLLSTGILQLYFPEVAISVPAWAFFSAILVAILTGIVFGLLPANRAARLDPVHALTAVD